MVAESRGHRLPRPTALRARFPPGARRWLNGARGVNNAAIVTSISILACSVEPPKTPVRFAGRLNRKMSP